MNKVEDLLSFAKLNDIMRKKEKEEIAEKESNTVLRILAVVGAVAAVAAIAYAVYRFFTPDYVDELEDDFEDDLEDDFFDADVVEE